MMEKYAVERDLILESEGSCLGINGYDTYKKIPLNSEYKLKVFKKNNSDEILTCFMNNNDYSLLSLDEICLLLESVCGREVNVYKRIVKNFRKIKIGFIIADFIILNVKELNTVINYFMRYDFEKGSIAKNLMYSHRNIKMIDGVRIKKIYKNTEIRMAGLSRIRNTYETVSFIGLSQSEGLGILDKIRAESIRTKIKAKIDSSIKDIFHLRNINRDYVEVFYKMLLCDLKEKNKGDVGMRKCDNIWDFMKYGDLRLTGRFWGDEVSGKLFTLKDLKNFGDYSFEFASYTKSGLQRYDVTIKFKGKKLNPEEIGDLLERLFGLGSLDYHYFTSHKTHKSGDFDLIGHNFKEIEFSYVEKLVNSVKDSDLKDKNDNEKGNFEDINIELQGSKINQETKEFELKLVISGRKMESYYRALNWFADIDVSEKDKMKYIKDIQELQDKLQKLEEQLSHKNNTIKQLKENNKKNKNEYESKIKSLKQSVKDLKRNNKPVRQEYIENRYNKKNIYIFNCE